MRLVLQRMQVMSEQLESVGERLAKVETQSAEWGQAHDEKPKPKKKPDAQELEIFAVVTKFEERLHTVEERLERGLRTITHQSAVSDAVTQEQKDRTQISHLAVEVNGFRLKLEDWELAMTKLAGQVEAIEETMRASKAKAMEREKTRRSPSKQRTLGEALEAAEAASGNESPEHSPEHAMAVLPSLQVSLTEVSYNHLETGTPSMKVEKEVEAPWYERSRTQTETDKAIQRLEGLQQPAAEAPQPETAGEAKATTTLGLEHERPYQFGESIYDAAMFIGTDYMGIGGSIVVSFLLFMNVLAQLVFTGITINVFGSWELDKDYLESIKTWRENVGHNIKYFEKTSYTALIERVCDKLPRLEMANDKAELLKDMETFWPWPNNRSFASLFFSGPAMCMVAVLVWTMVVLREIRNISSLILALKDVPNGHTEVAPGEGGSIRLAAFSRPRRSLVAGIIMLRVIVVAALLICGVQFLVVYTINISDIFLNSIALEVVISVPTIFYSVVPTQTRTLLARLEPLPTASLPGWRGADMRSIVWCCWIPIVLIVTYFMYIGPLLSNIEDIQDAMCGSKLGFAYAVDSVFMVSAVDLDSLPRAFLHEDLGYRVGIRELIGWQDVPQSSVPLALTMTMGQVLAYGDSSVAQTSQQTQEAFHQQCSDLLELTPYPGDVIARYFQAQLGVAQGGVTTCAQVLNTGMHLNFSADFARFACPAANGCADPLGAQMMTDPSRGCPAACSRTQSYRSRLAALSCAEGDAERSGDAMWTALSRSFESAVLSAPVQSTFETARGACGPPPCSDQPGSCAALFLRERCNLVQLWRNYTQVCLGAARDVCAGDWLGPRLQLRPLSTLCPITCGCNAVAAAEGLSGDELAAALEDRGCPTQCSAAAAR